MLLNQIYPSYNIKSAVNFEGLEHLTFELYNITFDIIVLVNQVFLVLDIQLRPYDLTSNA